MRRWLSTLALVGASVLTAPASPAIAAGSCPPGTAPSEGPQGTICIPAADPGSGGGGGTGETGGGGSAACTFGGAEIPCTKDGAVWFSSQGCYASQFDFPPEHPAWEGRTDGSIWICNGFGPDGIPGSGQTFWAPAPPVALPDPAVLAQQALDQMQLATPEVNLAPAPPLMTYVGLETWLWMPEGQWSTLTNSVTAGATTVTVTAEPVRATWDLETGTTTCGSAGRAWVAGMGDSARTDCSFTFDRVSDADGFAVSAVLTYQADWTCAGACLAGGGTLDEVDGLPGAAAIRVGERQSVVTGG